MDGWMDLIASREERVHGKVCEPVKLLEALVDSYLRCEMRVRELVHLCITNTNANINENRNTNTKANTSAGTCSPADLISPI